MLRLPDGEVPLPPTCNVLPAAVQCMALHGPSGRLAVGLSNGDLWLWDLREKELLRTWEGCHTGAVQGVILTKNRTYSVGDTTMKEHNNRNGNLLQEVDMESAVYSISLAANVGLVLMGCMDCITLMTLSHPRTTRTLRSSKMGNVVALCSVPDMIDPDQMTFFSGAYDGIIRHWDHTKSSPLLRELRGHRGIVHDIKYHNKMLFSASADCTVKVWDVTMRAPVVTIRCGQEWVVSVAVCGPWVYTASLDFTVRRWNGATGQLCATSRSRTQTYCLIESGEEYIFAGTVDMDGLGVVETLPVEWTDEDIQPKLDSSQASELWWNFLSDSTVGSSVLSQSLLLEKKSEKLGRIGSAASTRGTATSPRRQGRRKGEGIIAGQHSPRSTARATAAAPLELNSRNLPDPDTARGESARRPHKRVLASLNSAGW